MAGGPETKRFFYRDTWMKRGGSSRNVHVLYPALLGILIVVGGIITTLTVRWHMIDWLRDQLVTIQDSQEAAIRIWMKHERSDAAGWTYEPDLRAAVIELTDADGSDTPDDAEAKQRIIATLDGLLRNENMVGYVIFNRASEIIASSEPEFATKTLSASGLELARAVIGGEAIVTSPFIAGGFFQDADGATQAAMMIKAAPVLNQSDEVIAALAVAVRSDEFVGILSLGDFGQTGVTYAIGRQGWMMAESRVRDQFDALGLTPAEGMEGLGRVYQARDPGGDLTSGFTPELPDARQPLTFSAAAVTAGDTGYELEGYRNYLGVEVMGAWRWLDDLKFGLITEVEYREALAPLRPLFIAFGGLFLLLILAVAALVIYARLVGRLNRNIETVRQLGQYTLLDKIGEGAMGRVYRARHSLLARDTAVKMLKPDVVSEDAVARFEQEVQQTSQLKHPNTVEIYDFGRTDEGIFYYAMEYLDGYDLATLLETSGPMPASRTVHVLHQVCLSLREAHHAGLIHRDIKPNNIILCARGGEFDVVKVVDFGLVKDLRADRRGMTEANIIPGTPPYISPERMRDGADVDARVDIYALGAVGFSLLTGKLVFDGDTSVEIAYKAMHEKPSRPSERTAATIPETLDTLIHGMLAPNPDERPADVDTLLHLFDEIAAVLPWERAQAAAWWKGHPAGV
ncbi:MAG: serine/threonine protein kinase [Geminicoccaceae bacterium]